MRTVLANKLCKVDEGGRKHHILILVYNVLYIKLANYQYIHCGRQLFLPDTETRYLQSVVNLSPVTSSECPNIVAANSPVSYSYIANVLSVHDVAA